jgi:PAS domain S-box-containing protein
MNQKFEELQMICQAKNDRKSILQGAIDTVRMLKAAIENSKNKIENLKGIIGDEEEGQKVVVYQEMPNFPLDPVNFVHGSYCDFQKVYENVSAPIGIISVDGTFLDCNQAFCLLVGKEKESIVMQDTLLAMFSARDFGDFINDIQNIIERKFTQTQAEGEILHHSGQMIRVHVILSSLYDSSSTSVDYLSFIAIRR